MLVSALLRDMPPQNQSVKVFTHFGHWNQDVGVLEGEPDWKSISDVIEQELQKCVDQSAIHAELGSLGDAILGEHSALEILSIIRSPAMDSVKTSCLTAMIPQMSLTTIITELLVDVGRWNKATASFDGAPDWPALADAIESNAFESSATLRCKRRLHEAPDWGALLDSAGGGPAAAPFASLPAPAPDAARGRKKQRAKKASLSHEQWIAKLERVALGTD